MTNYNAATGARHDRRNRQVLVEDTLHLGRSMGIALIYICDESSAGAVKRAACNGTPTVTPPRHFVQINDPPTGVLVDEGVHPLVDVRSSSTWKRNKRSSGRISLDVRSSRTSRSRDAGCAVARPSVTRPERRCRARPQRALAGLAGAMIAPLAMDSITAHCDPWSQEHQRPLHCARSR